MLPILACLVLALRLGGLRRLPDGLVFSCGLALFGPGRQLFYIIISISGTGIRALRGHLVVHHGLLALGLLGVLAASSVGVDH